MNSELKHVKLQRCIHTWVDSWKDWSWPRDNLRTLSPSTDGNVLVDPYTISQIESNVDQYAFDLSLKSRPVSRIPLLVFYHSPQSGFTCLLLVIPRDTSWIQATLGYWNSDGNQSASLLHVMYRPIRNSHTPHPPGAFELFSLVVSFGWGIVFDEALAVFALSFTGPNALHQIYCITSLLILRV